MRKKPARRYETASLNTEKMFAEALKTLMKQMPLEKISIQKLADACGVNRKTFYYHFDSMDELLRWTLERDAIEAFRDIEQCSDPVELLDFIIEYSDTNRKMLRSAFRETDIGLKQLEMHGGFHRVVRLFVEEAEQKAGVRLPEGYRDYLMEFYIGALAHSFYQYIYERIPETRQAMVEYTRTVLETGISAALRTADPAPRA